MKPHVVSTRMLPGALAAGLESAGLVVTQDAIQAVTFFCSNLHRNAVNGATGFCIGSTTDEHARQRGFTQSVVAEIPSPESLIQGTINYYTPYSLHA